MSGEPMANTAFPHTIAPSMGGVQYPFWRKMRRELVDVRRRDFAALGILAMHVAASEIVGEDDEDVWLGRSAGAKSKRASRGDDEISASMSRIPLPCLRAR